MSNHSCYECGNVITLCICKGTELRRRIDLLYIGKIKKKKSNIKKGKRNESNC